MVNIKGSTKCCFFTFSIISVIGLLAIALLGIIVGVTYAKNGFIEAIEEQPAALGAGLGLMGLMILFIIFAIMLMCCKNKCFSFLYGFILIVVFLIFVAIGVALLVGKKHAKNWINE